MHNIRANWQRRFRRNAPSSYQRAKEYAAAGLQVFIERRNDIRHDVYQYAIIVADPRSGDDDFWMDAMDTEEQALALCAAMGWEVIA